MYYLFIIYLYIFSSKYLVLVHVQFVQNLVLVYVQNSTHILFNYLFYYITISLHNYNVSDYQQIHN